MPRLKAAHIREQGQNMIIFPLESAFGSQSQRDQNAALAELQHRANGAGLAGQAVAVWESSGRMHFLGPRPWEGFLRGLNMQQVLASVNKEISW